MLMRSLFSRRSNLRAGLLFLAAMLCAQLALAAGHAQIDAIEEPGDAPSLIDQLADHFESNPDEGRAAGPVGQDVGSETLTFPTLPAGYEPDEATLAAMNRSVEAYYKYRTDQFDHRLAAFRWQHVSTQLIFGVVVLIVFVGLYFSYVQFKRGEESGEGTGQTDFEASTSGLKISSPVLGVIILALSLVFFYLYLVHVYPITEVNV